MRFLIAFLVLALVASCQPFPPAGQLGTVWSPDSGDGTYRNPVIFADYSDPDVVRVGEDFYLTASSFNCVPGLPILHSRDLVNWRIIGHALSRFNYGNFDLPQHGNGVWAPSLRFHEGKFYIYYGDPDYGIFMVRATRAAGPWEPPVRLRAARGWIDCCPFWDGDGSAWLVHAFAASRAGFANVLHLNRMSTDGTRLLDDGKLIIDGNAAGLTTLEGAKMYKRHGWYYILAPAGGVTAGYQLAFRSKNIYGPYEQNKVLAQGSTAINGPHQGGWVETEGGESWFIHFQDRSAYGRVVHLQPVQWRDDWPVMGTNGEPVLVHQKPDVRSAASFAVPQTTDEFSAPDLGLQWQWHGNPRENWSSLAARKGWLRLNAVPLSAGATNLWAAPNLLLQKLPAEQFVVTTSLDPSRLATGDKTGLIIMGMDYSYLCVLKTVKGWCLQKISCHNANTGGRETIESTTDVAAAVVHLRVRVTSGANCEFSYGIDGKEFTDIGQPFRARAGRWIGAKVGLFCMAGSESASTGNAEYDWVRFSR